MSWWLALPAGLFALALGSAHAQPVDVYLFWRAGCPHCERELEFLERLGAREPLRVHKFEVMRERENARLMVRVAERLGAEAGSVPFTVIGERFWIGYLDDASTGREIEAQVAECRLRGCTDVVAAAAPAKEKASAKPAPRLPETVRLPLLGEVRTAALSLPALTVVLAAVDGFNPCAMWVLVFLLGLLAGMRDRARMWVLGGAFVAASALFYLLVLGAWLNVLLFLGALLWVRLAIGSLALAGGGWYLKEFFSRKDLVCEVTAPEKRQRIFARLKSLAQQRSFLAALAGIVLLAFAVNVVEFLCSAGIPAVFTQVLALSQLSAGQYFAYLLLYVLVFMADDLVVLVVALKTLEVTGLTTTYARWSNLLGGVVLIAIGVALLAKPEWLIFG